MIITIFATALRDEARSRIKEIGQVDLLVGIPCYNNQRTVGYVINTVETGLRKYSPNKRSLIVVSDGGSTDDSREMAQGLPRSAGVERLVTIYRGLPGKGSSLRAVFEIGYALRADVIIVVDSDLKSIVPEWIELLADPILKGEYEFVAPYYTRHKYDGTITKLLAYPLTRAIFGRRIRQPIGGEFGICRELFDFYIKQDVWETDVAKYGIDIWLTITAIEQGVKVCQSRLGTKVHTGREPTTLGPMFRQVAGTLFTLMAQHEDKLYRIKESDEVDFYGRASKVEPDPVKVSVQDLIENFCLGFGHFSPLWREVLSEESFNEVEKVFLKSRDEFNFPSDLWAKVVYDFALNYKKWKKDKQKLVSMMTPLYYGRTASYILEARDISTKKADQLIENQAQIFEEVKPYLVKRATKLFEKM